MESSLTKIICQERYSGYEYAIQGIVNIINKNNRARIALPGGSDAEKFLPLLFSKLQDLFSKRKVEGIEFYQSEELLFSSGKSSNIFSRQIKKSLENSIFEVLYLNLKSKKYLDELKKINFDVAVEGVDRNGRILGVQELREKDTLYKRDVADICGDEWESLLRDKFNIKGEVPEHFCSLGEKVILHTELLILIVNGKEKKSVIDRFIKRDQSLLLTNVVLAREEDGLHTIIITDQEIQTQ